MLEPFKHLGPMWNIQRKLSQAQEIPIVGPLIASPIKALVSSVEFVAGAALAILSGTFGFLCNSDDLLYYAWKSASHAGLGLWCLGYSVGNFFTFGILGMKVEEWIRQSRLLDE